ncbi:hypothetical protein GCM10027048_11690 [Hymenobacter coalescens]
MSYKFMPVLLAAALLAGPALAQDGPGKQKVKVKRKNKDKTEAPAAPAPAAEQPTRQAPLPLDNARTYAESITQADLRQHLSVLASDAYEGRETGEKGQKMAADYLANRFKELDLVGPVPNSDNPYLQHFTMVRSSWAPEKISLRVGSKSYKWLTDFYAIGTSPFDAATTMRPVFVGYGISEAGRWDDYAGLDVKGKDLIIMAGEPSDAAGKPLLSADGQPTKWGSNFRSKAAVALEKGARSVFFVDHDAASFRSGMSTQAARYSRPSIAFADKLQGKLVSFYVSPELGYQLLGTTAAGWRSYAAAANKAGKPTKATFKPASFTLQAPQQRSSFTTENVLGYLEGTDKKDEVLVVSAHYDHIGVIDGEVHNGADDDGSGTVSVLEMAEAFVQAKRAGHGPRRSILFLTVTGEEKGLLGSEYYTDHPIFPLERTVADLNIDMVGRTDKEHEGQPDYVYVIGSDKLSSELHRIVLNVNEQYTGLDLDFRFNDPGDPNRFYYRSDHYNFAKHKVPVAFFFNGVHADYHGPKDEVDKIEFPKMEKRARLVYYAAWELANREQRIVVDSNKP